MTLAEYKKMMKADETWAPGWESILKSMTKLYKNQSPTNYQTELYTYNGGSDYLYGFSVFENGDVQKHSHIISYGMSALFPHEVYFGKDYSGWGYEMTMRIKNDGNDKCLWAMDMMSNLASYTNTNENAWLESDQFIEGSGEPINLDSKSKITSLITILDPQLPPIDTIHGRLEFIELVGITTDEFNAVCENPNNLKKLIENMRKDNPLFITDLARTKNYI